MEYVISLSVVGIVLLLILFLYQSRMIKITRNYVQDGLTASNLAAAIIDLAEFGASHEILISDEVRAYEEFRTALRENLRLDEQERALENSLLKGQIRIEDFIIYNVENHLVYQLGKKDGAWLTKNCLGSQGDVRTPDGTVIESTTIYSRICFPIQGWIGQVREVTVQKSVDVVTRE
ncbi:hypothetical protein [Diplocloster agilis]|uniref:Uncharacterized protein n=1 Tax=Diplocloster agilis TaxID=2850323 RepID=A0A949JWN9_9FIRM|nr:MULTISPECIES: hypothetical protein [Lachnospiraceae]MBU9735474.1 hypothetical protein [Diplocloster agilis]MBU9742318.1 hypothetical protein [Diplocloster agilis]MCU6733027.1 hypothetical protein [Suonthocola fibrivorans]SCI72944.1 Uncharacterised protein [uncultured Clostridium sp.]